MTRRREARRRHREERKRRLPEERQAAKAPGPTARLASERNISWMGLAGGVLGALLLAQAAVYNLISDDGTTFAAATLAVLASAYLPAVWASVVDTPRRQAVLRGVLAVTLVFVVAGVLFVDAAFATLLIVPSTLLAIAAGLVFQGRPRP